MTSPDAASGDAAEDGCGMIDLDRWDAVVRKLEAAAAGPQYSGGKATSHVSILVVAILSAWQVASQVARLASWADGRSNSTNADSARIFVMSKSSRVTPATVYLVGAGPGDPGLISVRGAELLRRADTVLYDYLVNPRLLNYAPAGAERICLGRHGEGRIWSQSEIHAEMIRRARAGQITVRLKGGDPMVFARASEEIQALATAGIPFEIVPGVTAALAAGSYVGLPLTHREHASALALVTGQEDTDKLDSTLDYAALAMFPGTLVFYMGVTTAEHWTGALIAGGKPATTPAMIVRRCSLPDQQQVRCTLNEVAATIARERIRPPVVVVIGEVASGQTDFSWFTQRPLFGQRVLVTRPQDQADSVTERLEELGASVLLQPAIEILPPDDWEPVDEAIEHLDEFDWVVFSSANGVRYFLDRMLAKTRDIRTIAGPRLACIGPGTAGELAKYRLCPDLVPSKFQAEELARLLVPQATNGKFLLVRASRGREVLAEQLRQAGGTVRQVVAYRSLDVIDAAPQVAEKLAAGQISWVLVTSSAIARSLSKMFGKNLRQAKLASISPITSQTLRECGFEPTVEASDYTMPGIVSAILEG